MATTFAVPDGRVAMAATTYTGNGSTQAVSNAVNTVGMQPDLVWVKARNNTGSHQLIDSVRGIPLFLFSDGTAADSSRPNSFTSFNSNGYTVGSSSDGNTNLNTYTYVAWQWKAGGTAVSNTAGTITSQVSANTTAGFSVVTYTGNGINGATVGHGLGVKPSLIIEKGRSTAYNWSVQGCGVLWTPATSTLFLNATNALSISGAIAAPTASVFTPSATLYANESGVSNVAYCWAPVAGYSAFGSYTGNGSADGPFIYTGFRPRWVMIKEITVGGTPWMMWDSSRDTYNPEAARLVPNTSDAELSVSVGDFVSNGIKLRVTGTSYNATGSTYIYAAFAENPLKYANAR